MNKNDVLVDCREVFVIYANDDGKLPRDSLVDAIRSLQIALDDMEFAKIIQSQKNAYLTFDEFVKLVIDIFSNIEQDPQEELYEALKVFDKGNDGYVKAADLKYILTTIGEVLTMDQINYILSRLEIGKDNKIPIKSVIQLLCQK